MPRWMHHVVSSALTWIAETQQRHIMRELQRLDDRTLADIGLNAEEIDYIVRGDSLGPRARGRRRAVIAKSALGIMAAEPHMLASTPIRCPVLPLLAVLGVLLSLGLTAAVSAQTDPAKPTRSLVPFAASGPSSFHIPR